MLEANLSYDKRNSGKLISEEWKNTIEGRRMMRGQPAAAQGLPAAAHPGQGVRLTHGFFIGRRMRG